MKIICTFLFIILSAYEVNLLKLSQNLPFTNHLPLDYDINQLIREVLYKQSVLYQLKSIKNHEEKHAVTKLLKKKENKTHFIKRKLSNFAKKSLDDLEEIHKNISSLYLNSTKKVEEELSLLRAERKNFTKDLFFDVKPFLKTLNQMQAYSLNSQNSFDSSLAKLNMNQKTFKLEVGKELNDLKKILHLSGDEPSDIGKSKTIDEQDVFAEDDNFLESNSTENKDDTNKNLSLDNKYKKTILLFVTIDTFSH